MLSINLKFKINIQQIDNNIVYCAFIRCQMSKEILSWVSKPMRSVRTLGPGKLNKFPQRFIGLVLGLTSASGYSVLNYHIYYQASRPLGFIH